MALNQARKKQVTMNYMPLSPSRHLFVGILLIAAIGAVFGQSPTSVFVKNVDLSAEIAGAWQFDLGERSGMKILKINQTGSVGIGTFHNAPVIVNVFGNLVKFKCDMRIDGGKKVRYMFKGEVIDEEIIGKMTIYSYKERSFETRELVVKKVI